jgi:hypothetical protein
VGIDPSPFTLRELLWMARGQQKEQWTHTAHLLVTLANTSALRDPKKSAITFAEVYPFTKKSKSLHDMAALKAEWMGMVSQQQ